MGNFETIVRPVVFPNIRPTQPRSVAPENDPEKGFAHINGQGGAIVSLPYNFTHNMSKTKQKEVKRRVDRVRVYQKDDDDTVNRDNFVDIEVVNKLWIKESGAAGVDNSGTPTPGGGSADLEIPINFARVKETDNIEFLEENIIKRNEDT